MRELWEYKVLDYSGDKTEFENPHWLEYSLNKLGGEGWNLIDIREGKYIFKRKMELMIDFDKIRQSDEDFVRPEQRSEEIKEKRKNTDRSKRNRVRSHKVKKISSEPSEEFDDQQFENRNILNERNILKERIIKIAKENQKPLNYPFIYSILKERNELPPEKVKSEILKIIYDKKIFKRIQHGYYQLINYNNSIRSH